MREPGVRSVEDTAVQNPYSLFFESNPQPMWLVDRETLQFIDVNPAAVQMYEYPREIFLRMSLVDIQAMDGVPAFLKVWRHFQDTSGGQLPGEWKHVTEGGSVLTVELLRTRRDPYAKEELVICRDITSRKQIEGCLRVRYALTRVFSEVPADATAQILRVLCNELGFESAELWLADPRRTTLQRHDTWSSAALGRLGKASPAAMAYLNAGLLARVCRSGSVVWTSERSFQHGWAYSASHDSGIRGALCFAIRRRSENCGVIVLFGRSAKAPAQAALDLIRAIGDEIGLTLEHSQAEGRPRIVSSVAGRPPGCALAHLKS